MDRLLLDSLLGGRGAQEQFFARRGFGGSEAPVDDWERLVFGPSGGSATNDADGDGYSDLQEYLDGTDPMASSSTSGGGAVSFALPDLDVAITGTTVSLSWSWPAAYRSNFQFKIQSATSLSGTFADRATVPKGQAETSITGETAATNRFYRVGVSLKP